MCQSINIKTFCVYSREEFYMGLLYVIFPKDTRASPCAEVNSSSTVVPLGSAVTASCYIRQDCQLKKKLDFFIKWKKNAHFIPNSETSQKNVNEILISNFTDTQAILECFICDHIICNLVGGVVIRAMRKDLILYYIFLQNIGEGWCNSNTLNLG